MDTIQMIKAGHPVFFGCDVGQGEDRDGGILDADLYEYGVRIIRHIIRSFSNSPPPERIRHHAGPQQAGPPRDRRIGDEPRDGHLRGAPRCGGQARAIQDRELVGPCPRRPGVLPHDGQVVRRVSRSIAYMRPACPEHETLCRYVYQVVVPKSLAPKNLVEVLEKGEKTVLPPWDPMARLSSASFFICLTQTLSYRAHWHNLP